MTVKKEITICQCLNFDGKINCDIEVQVPTDEVNRNRGYFMIAHGCKKNPPSDAKVIERKDTYSWYELKGHCHLCGSMIGNIIKGENFSSFPFMHLSRVHGNIGMIGIVFHSIEYSGIQVHRFNILREEWEKLHVNEKKEWENNRDNPANLKKTE